MDEQALENPEEYFDEEAFLAALMAEGYGEISGGGEETAESGGEAGGDSGDGELLQIIEWVAEQMPGGFFIYRADPSQELLYVNTGVLRIFGCASVAEFRELTGGTFQGMVHPDDLDSVQRSIDAQIANLDNENLDYVEYRIIRRDGTVRRVDDYGHYSWMPGYGEVHFVFLSDATDKYRARRENVRRAEVIEGLSVDFNAIFLADLDRRTLRPYRLNNSVFAELRDGKPEADCAEADWQEVFARYAREYVVEPDRERLAGELTPEKLRERLQEAASYTVDYRIVNREDSVRFMQMSVVRIDSEDGRNHAVLGFRDVSEQFMRIQRETSEKLRMEMELDREKQARDTKSAFLFNISHDIRTPMNAIVGYTDLARRHAEDPERLRDYLDKVHDSSFQMMDLIEDLLEMSQLDSGRVQLKNEVCSLREQLDKAVAAFRDQAEEKHLTLTADFQIPDRPVLLDPLRFRRVLTNLIGNAVKFTKPGGSVTVSAREKQVSESGYARYEFVVSDTGVGMTEEFMSRMFRAFEREETSTRSGTRGTGLGLSIVKSLLDVMGGSISVESKKGKGSAFTVSLPVRLSDGSAPPPEEHPAEYASKQPGERRILLVEDIEINRMLAETILEEAGFLVESVPDGCDAVDAVSGHPLWYYDLILMDIQMPVMNGYEATRAIRALNREDVKSLPIIALSANAREEDRQHSIESGMNYHVAKPFDVPSLIATVNEHIEHADEREQD